MSQEGLIINARQYLKKKKAKVKKGVYTRGVIQVVERLPCKQKALSSNIVLQINK
jgi:hypothetical protein